MYEKNKKMDSAVKAVLHSQLLPDFFVYWPEFFSWSRAIVSSMALLMKAVVLSSIAAACS